MKKIIALISALLITVLSFAGCGGKNDGTLKIGIIQYMSHASLDNCYNGVVAALEEIKKANKYFKYMGNYKKFEF